MPNTDTTDEIQTRAKEATDTLGDKQRAFVTAYMAGGFNATAAAIAAGYSKTSAHTIGWENLRKPEIARALALHLAARGITPEAVQCRLAQIAWSADLADFEPFLTGEKTLSDLREAGVDTTLVSQARVTKSRAGETRTIHLADSLAALNSLARVMGLVTDRMDLTTRGEAISPGKTLSNMSPTEREAAIAELENMQGGPD